MKGVFTLKKVVLITGGTHGIGRTLTKSMILAGYRVCFTYSKSEEEANSLLSKLNIYKDDLMCLQADVRDYNKAKDVIRTVQECMGGLDILVNNAGVSIDRPFYLMREIDWDKVMDTNTKGVFNYSKAVTKSFIKQKSGIIINISSISGMRYFTGQVNYSASKAAISQMTKSLGRELGSYGIRVNAIAPGYVETDLNKNIPSNIKDKILDDIVFGRFAQAEEIASLLLYLISDKACYITGQTIVIDGGLSI